MEILSKKIEIEIQKKQEMNQLLFKMFPRKVFELNPILPYYYFRLSLTILILSALTFCLVLDFFVHCWYWPRVSGQYNLFCQNFGFNLFEQKFNKNKYSHWRNRSTIITLQGFVKNVFGVKWLLGVQKNWRTKKLA